MNDASEELDPAAVFGCAISLYHECQRICKSEGRPNLSECYNGGDEFMRVVMRTAARFERWACSHIAFAELDDVWPYLMEDQFGLACVEVMGASNLAEFDDSDCLPVALHLRLPIRLDTNLPVPVKMIAVNPTTDSGFFAFGILTMRKSDDGEDCEPLSIDDDPYDAEFELPYFSLFGIGKDGIREHIADRNTYSEAVSLARKIAPGIAFQDVLTFPNQKQ
jgi:hypothetical protein